MPAMITSASPATRRVSSRISAEPAIAASEMPIGANGVPVEFLISVP